jgi:hypothetical protein
VAVCLLPGTEVAFENDIEFEGGYGIFLNWKREKRAGGTVARFRQVDVGKPHVHHDALEFPDGKIVLLTRVIEGQHATVLQLPASPQRKAQDQNPVSRSKVLIRPLRPWVISALLNSRSKSWAA